MIDLLQRLDEAANKPSIRKRLQKLDRTIDEFLDMLENQALKIGENPTFQDKVLQLLANTNKEHGEFMMALKRVASALDSKGMKVAAIPGNSKGYPPGQDPYSKPAPEEPVEGDEEPVEESAQITEANKAVVGVTKNLADSMKKIRKKIEDKVSYLSGMDLINGAQSVEELKRLETAYLAQLVKIANILKG